jgi:hypothetical protein
MERTTRKHLERKVKYLATLGIELTLDRYQPGGLKNIWAVDSVDGSHHRYFSGRLTTNECYIFLCGMIVAAERFKGPQFGDV